jgi:xanthine/CO dehydrogenase XdhC/CoxF family maturation factor
MSELRALVAAARESREKGVAFVSATVVEVRGSGYRKAGARMIATESEWLAGSISGGCLERDITTKGFWYTRLADQAHTRARLITYDQAADVGDENAEQSTTGCQGIVDVLIERHEPGDPSAADVFDAIERCIRDESVAVLVTVIRSSRADLPVGARLVLQGDVWRHAPAHASLRELAGLEAQRALKTLSAPYIAERNTEAGELSVLVEPIVPPIHLFVFGSAHDAGPVVMLAKQLGWSVSVWDAAPRSSARGRFQAADHYLTGSLEDAVARMSRCVRAAAVVMGHHLARDRAAVEALLRSSARYIGILGARSRTEEIMAWCRAAGVELDAEAMSRVYAPVGLSLGAQTPAEIALAIVAQVQSVLARAEPNVISCV